MTLISIKYPFLLFYSALVIVFTFSNLPAQSHNRIAAFGSSVCNGAGDHLNQGGYIGRYQKLMAAYGWEVINVSRGGDNTTTINDRWERTELPPSRAVGDDQYLLPQKPDYVIIGLSLNNEGLRTVPEEKQDSIFEKFRSGILRIAERCRKEGFRTVVANCYANQLFSDKHYDRTKKMNLAINNFDLPSINLLGALDDGQGRWPEGFNYDDIHPSGGGHREMFFSLVPSLFDAIKTGKPAPKFSTDPGFASVQKTSAAALTFTPTDTMHSFAVSFLFRKSGSSVIAGIKGYKASGIPTDFEIKGKPARGIVFYASNEPGKCSLEIKDGQLIYNSVDGVIAASSEKLEDKWYRITLSHRFAKGETLVFLNDQLIGRTEERLVPESFLFGLKGKTDLKDISIYRSSLNEDEAKYISEGKMIQSSLEIYAPLRDSGFRLNSEVKNLAQSMSALKVTGKLKSN